MLRRGGAVRWADLRSLFRRVLDDEQAESVAAAVARALAELATQPASQVEAMVEVAESRAGLPYLTALLRSNGTGDALGTAVLARLLSAGRPRVSPELRLPFDLDLRLLSVRFEP